MNKCLAIYSDHRKANFYTNSATIFYIKTKKKAFLHFENYFHKSDHNSYLTLFLAIHLITSWGGDCNAVSDRLAHNVGVGFLGFW